MNPYFAILDPTMGAWVAAVCVLAIGPFLGIAVFGGVYYLFSLPMRRRERIRLFLDLLEGGIDRGQSLERVMVGLAHSGDRTLGRRLNGLVRQVEQGVRLDRALLAAPGILPPEIAGLIRAGWEAGNLKRLLPACRESLRDGVTEVWKAQHYLVLLAFVITPSWFLAIQMVVFRIAPKIEAIFTDLSESAALPGWFVWGTHHSGWIAGAQALALIGCWSWAGLYIGGPRFRARLGELWPRLTSRVTRHLAWRRSRMTRNFSAALAVLLDAGLPESRAVQIAATTSTDRDFAARTSATIDDLSRGVGLAQAIQRLDPTGEFEWRLTNATHPTGGFERALAGWHEALEARAFHQEQVFAQLLTTGLVLFNGLIVGVLAVGLFDLFRHLILTSLLW